MYLNFDQIRKVCLLAILGLASSADATTFCVNSTDALPTALTAVGSNGESDDIRLQSGAYPVGVLL